MKKQFPLMALILVFSLASLSACNLPERQALPTPTQPAASVIESTPTPTPLCANRYFPTASGSRWEYSGSDSLTGAYTRTDTVTNTQAASFTLATSVGNVAYSVVYDCTSKGLTSENPIQQYAGALLSSPDAPVSVKMTSNSSSSLPAQMTPGDTWQQTADWQASSPQLNINGRFVFDYTAIGSENISVPAGTYNAFRVDTTIRIEVTGLHVLAGTYTTTSWWAPDVGLVKSEGTSHVPGVDYTDSMQLTRFTPGP